MNRLRDELRRKGRQPEATALDGLEVDSAESPLEQAIGREAVECYGAERIGDRVGFVDGAHQACARLYSASVAVAPQFPATRFGAKVNARQAMF